LANRSTIRNPRRRQVGNAHCHQLPANVGLNRSRQIPLEHVGTVPKAPATSFGSNAMALMTDANDVPEA